MTDNAVSAANMGGDIETTDINDSDILQVQNLRKLFIAQLTPGGKVPSSMEDRQFLLAVMGQTTSTALASKKIKADEKSTATQAAIAMSFAEVVRSSTANASANLRAQAKRRGKSIEEMREVEEVEIKNVPGHRDIGFIPVSTASIANGGDGTIKSS